MLLPDVVHGEADPPERHVPFTEKQPPAKSIPLVKVLVAEPVMLRAVDCSPPPRVEVAVEVPVK